MEPCDICGNRVRPGKMGESAWVCTNPDCEKSNPGWVIKKTFNLD